MKNSILRQIIRLFSGSIIFMERKGIKNFRPISDLDEELSTLIELFQGIGCQVFLVGGIGMAVRQGKFYRNHKDFDLAVFTEDLAEFREYLKGRGYRFVRRSFVAKIAPKLYIQFYVPFDPASIRRLYAGKHVVKLLKTGREKAFRIRGRLELIDVLLLGKADKGVYDYAYRAIIPWKDFLPIEKLTDESNLLLPNIAYKKYLPSYTQRSKEDLNIAGIRPK